MSVSLNLDELKKIKDVANLATGSGPTEDSGATLSIPVNAISGMESTTVSLPDPNSAYWFQNGADIDGEAANDSSGRSVSLSADGTVVAIGAHGNDGVNNSSANSGHVRIYEWNGSSWIKVGDDIDGEAESD